MQESDSNRRRGAPHKPDEMKRTARLGAVQLTEEQLATYELVAKMEGKSKSQCIRDTLDARCELALLFAKQPKPE